MNIAQTCKIPKIAIFGLGLTIFNSWVLFEETIIDRKGWHAFLPYYRVATPCIWDAAAAFLIVAAGVWFWRKKAN